MSRHHKPRIESYAVVRVDHDLSADLKDRISVKEVVSTIELAQAEVLRLSELNADKGCYYFATPTRVFPAGKTAGPDR